MQTTFEDRLVELQAQGILSAEVVSSFQENDRPAHHGSTACLRHTIRRAVLSGDFRLCRSDIFYLSGVSRRDHRYIRRPAERARPAAGRKDLLSPSTVFRDRFLPFRKRTGANAAGAISGGTGGHPQPDTTVPFSAFHAFRRDHGRFSHPEPEEMLSRIYRHA